MKRRSAVTCSAAALAISVLGTVVALGAQAEPATPLASAAGATGTRFTGLAFDTCAAPSRATMRTWKAASPYGAIGIYISGDHRACDQPELTREWVRDVSAMGWRLLPLDVGLQAPCAENQRLRPMSREPRTADVQGAAAAEKAAEAAARLGLLQGSALYSDVEPYDTADPACAEAVRSYWSGWTRTLHRAGFLAGAYGSLTSAVQDLAVSHSSTLYDRPDVVWNSFWDKGGTLQNWAGVPDDYWAGHQRIKQFRGDARETFGGATLVTDRNIVDAPAATVAYSYRLVDRGATQAFMRPHVTGRALDIHRPGSNASVVCRTRTVQGVWNKLVDGSYVSDTVISDGPPKANVPACTIPRQIVSSDLYMRAGPTKTSPVKGTLPGGALAWVVCESPGTTLGRPGYWHLLDNGNWISGAFLMTPQANARTLDVPLCAGSNAEDPTM